MNDKEKLNSSSNKGNASSSTDSKRTIGNNKSISLEHDASSMPPMQSKSKTSNANLIPKKITKPICE